MNRGEEIEGLAEAAERVAEAAKAAMRLDRAACRVHAEQHCDAEHMVDRYEALYTEMVGTAAIMPFGTSASMPVVAHVA